MQCSKRILYLSDNPNSATAADLKLLYPDGLETASFLDVEHGVDLLSTYDVVISMVHDGQHLGRLDTDALQHFAANGGKLACALFEYANMREAHMIKTHVGNRMRPGWRIERECPVTAGFAQGDELWWFGCVSSAPDTLYENQMLQRQVAGVRESATRSILATSTVNGAATMIHEQYGDGDILALDLLSPGRPFYNSHGTTNKYLFLGNWINESVRYGRHYPKRLSYDEFVTAMQRLSARFTQLRMLSQGPCSDGRDLWTLELNSPELPTIYLGAAVHGWEWENAFGLLRLAELLCETPVIDGLDTSQFHFCIMPVQNPAGYDAFTRQNARGVDLNRNFDSGWDDLPEPQDVVVPWDYNYKGARAASEPETQAIQRLIDTYTPVGLIDFHTADYIMLVPEKRDVPLVDAIQADIQARLKDRYVTQRPYNGPYQQVNMDRMSESGLLPYLFVYAAERGCPAAFLVEMSGNRDDAHALAMNTDTVVEICLATAAQIARRNVG